jgi:AcrR family transcriptional regulator
MEELIITKARALFFSYGLKSISMDDIAAHAGISKKTIYKSFEDKSQLVQLLITELLNCHTKALQQSSRDANNAIEALINSIGTPFNLMAGINIGFMYELEKFYPAIWKLIIEHKQNVLIPVIIENLKQGIEEGLYRPEMDIAFVAEVRVQQIMTAFDAKTFTDRLVQRNQLLQQLTELFLHSVATTKGKKLIDKYLKVNNEKQFSN